MYNNACYKWKIRNQLEFYDLLNDISGDIDSVIKCVNNKYMAHLEFVCSDLYNDFNDNNTNVWKVLSLDLLRTIGFEGPHNFDTVKGSALTIIL